MWTAAFSNREPEGLSPSKMQGGLGERSPPGTLANGWASIASLAVAVVPFSHPCVGAGETPAVAVAVSAIATPIGSAEK